ncbi:uncharacterized protein LODBEIA_P09320 [Lodderomyces beijingensis]|uniref:Class E vacuolar protein-sorting machinery protein HSE1 n=1 Tax=Lodderomyces beijingensis TaxID=1775926 RepID=A0ABP0ZGJ4_9ASCO
MSRLDSLVNKATDPTLTADNWQYILDVCDKISSDPEAETTRAIEVIKSKITSSKDANTILRCLSLLVATAENCGSRMKQEIATKSFLQDCLVKKLSDKKLHITVKYRIVEVVEQLSKSFKSDPSLKPVNDAYAQIKKEFPQLIKAQQGPSVPAKQERTQQDKNKEDEELQRVLKLSLQEYENEQNLKKQYLNSKPLPETKKAEQEPPASPPGSEETETIATVSKVRAIYDLISYEEDELSFKKGDVITVIESVYRDWWRGSLPNGKIGIFPLNYVTPIVNKSAKELAAEAEQENKLLNVEQKKIDRLLALLSSTNPLQVNEDEVTELYNQVIASRIQLSNLIDKYSVRQEELGVLNNQLTNEVKSYNDLLDQSIANRSKQHHASQSYNQSPYPVSSQLTFPLPLGPQQQPPQQQQQQHQNPGYQAQQASGRPSQQAQQAPDHYYPHTQHHPQQNQAQPSYIPAQLTQQQSQLGPNYTHSSYIPQQLTQQSQPANSHVPAQVSNASQSSSPYPTYQSAETSYQRALQEQRTSAGFGNE